MEKENLLMDYICDHIYKCDYKKRSNENLIKFVKDSLKDAELSKYYLYKTLLEVVSEDKPKRTSAVDQIFSLFIPEFFYVYRLISKGDIVYVGQSINISSRVGQHFKDKVFDTVELCACPNKDFMDTLENYEIFLNMPKYNKDLKVHLVNKFKEDPFEYEFKDFKEVEYDFIPCIPIKFERSSRLEGYLYKYPFFVRNTKGIKPHWQKEN